MNKEMSLQKESEWEKEWTKLSGFNDMTNIGKVKSLKKFMRKAIATAVSTREKEIAEEVEKEMKKATELPVSEIRDVAIVILERVLSILKH